MHSGNSWRCLSTQCRFQATLVDVICINRYFGWYIDTGYLDSVNSSWIFDILNWRIRHNKPIIISEYGAEAIPGLNQVFSVDFT